MLDYFVAVGVALVGLLVVYFMFQSINRLDTVAVASPAASQLRGAAQRKSRARKTPRPPRREDAELDRETEALIAREVARQQATSGMRADTRVPRPQLLEEVRKDVKGKPTNNNNNNNNNNKTQPLVVEGKQELIDKELGFQRVTNQPKARKVASPNVKQSLPTFTLDEEMERKLGQFFSNSNRREKKTFKFALKEEPTTNNNGAQVIVKKDISNARSW